MIEEINNQDFMTMDLYTKKSLELTENSKDHEKYGSLFWLLDMTKSAMGARLLKNYIDRPLLKKEAIDYEIIFVDDGSKDGTWQQIEQTQKEDQHVNGVRFSRNFGKESAMMAGLENAGGDCVFVMDCDLHQRQSWRCIGCGSRDTKLSRA